MTSPASRLSLGGQLGRSLLTVALAASVATVAFTGAVFTDTDDVGANTFATGDIDLTTNPTTSIVAFATDMAPGDVDTGSVTVTNSGSLALRYALSSDTTEDTLAAQLDLTVWAEADELTTGDGCDTTAPLTVLYGPADLGSTAGTAIFGSATQGADAGDRVLAAAANEVLCFRVELPLTTGNAFESLSTTSTLTFASEQTANN